MRSAICLERHDSQHTRRERHRKETVRYQLPHIQLRTDDDPRPAAVEYGVRGAMLEPERSGSSTFHCCRVPPAYLIHHATPPLFEGGVNGRENHHGLRGSSCKAAGADECVLLLSGVNGRDAPRRSFCAEDGGIASSPGSRIVHLSSGSIACPRSAFQTVSPVLRRCGFAVTRVRQPKSAPTWLSCMRSASRACSLLLE